MGYCWDYRKIPWAIIPNTPWYTISRPWYFTRRNIKSPWGFSRDFFEIFLLRWNFYLAVFCFDFNGKRGRDRAFRVCSDFVFFDSGFVTVSLRIRSDSVSAVLHPDRNRPESHWPSITVIVTVHHCSSAGPITDRRQKRVTKALNGHCNTNYDGRS